jgi:hypothetical protein
MAADNDINSCYLPRDFFCAFHARIRKHDENINIVPEGTYLLLENGHFFTPGNWTGIISIGFQDILLVFFSDNSGDAHFEIIKGYNTCRLSHRVTRVFIDNICAERWDLELLSGVDEEIQSKAEFKVTEIKRMVRHACHGLYRCF